MLFDEQVRLVEQGEEFVLRLRTQYLDAHLPEVWYTLEDGAVGEMAAHMDDASEFGPLAYLEGIVFPQRVLHALADLLFEFHEENRPFYSNAAVHFLYNINHV